MHSSIPKVEPPETLTNVNDVKVSDEDGLLLLLLLRCRDTSCFFFLCGGVSRGIARLRVTPPLCISDNQLH